MNPVRIGCEHEQFECGNIVNRLTQDDGTIRFVLEVVCRCSDCGVSMRFLGLPIGIDMNSASTSPDGLECRLAIHPADKTIKLDKKVEGHAIDPQSEKPE